MKYIAVRNIRLCTKDCLCLYVCPVGATDTEDSIIDVKKCIGCGDCAKACPSGAISLVPLTYPPQQSKDLSLVHLSHTLTTQKAKQEQLARQLMNSHNDELYRLMKAFVKSIRLVHEDIMREAGFMLPQSANTQQLLESFVENPPCDDFPTDVAQNLLTKISFHEVTTIQYHCLVCGAIFEVKNNETPVCPICKATGEQLERIEKEGSL